MLKTNPSSMQRSIPSWELLEGLPEGTPQIEYSNMKELRTIIEAQAWECCEDKFYNPFLIVSGVPDTILEEFDSVYQDKGPRISANLKIKTLVIETMVGVPHERISQRLGFHISHILNHMGVQDELGEQGAGRIKTKDRGYVKEPDMSWVFGEEIWPTLVLEVGWAEGPRKLANDARGWLEAGRSEVVITAKLDRHHAHIDYAVWELAPEPVRITRSYRRPAQQTQRAEVSRRNGVTTASSDLTIPFKLILRREPATSQEGDLILTKDKLVNIAEWAWREPELDFADYP